MISETEFAHRYTSLWHQVLPMADAIVRAINVSYKRFGGEIPSLAAPTRRGYVNELGFRIFAASIHDGKLEFGNLDAEALKRLEQETAAFLTRVRPNAVLYPAGVAEREEAMSLSRQLYIFFKSIPILNALHVDPQFPGCGILNSSIGDIYSEPTLYEIKAGARDFRVVDLRQVVTYCALNFASGGYNIDTVVLVNPRLGIYSSLRIHDSVSRASGQPAAVVYKQILDFLSQDLTPDYG